jgi:hypothetical protein
VLCGPDRVSEGADRRYRVGTFGVLKADASLLVKLSGRRPGRAPNTLAPKNAHTLPFLRCRTVRRLDQGLRGGGEQPEARGCFREQGTSVLSAPTGARCLGRPRGGRARAPRGCEARRGPRLRRSKRQVPWQPELQNSTRPCENYAAL